MLADRGFTIHEAVAQKGAVLTIPDFQKKDLNQLTPYQVENTRGLARIRIHVERVIGSVHNKFRITQGPISMTMLQDMYEGVRFIDYILRVSCMLINLCDSIVDIS